METIKLPISKGMHTLIDLDDYERLVSDGLLKWNAQKCYKRFYVSRSVKEKKLYLHRYIMGVDGKGMCIDHINGDPLDNRKSNLRVCSHRENSRNKKKKHGFKGVSKYNSTFAAQIQINNEHVNIGYFSTPSDAARAYDFAAAIFFGEFASFNFDFSKKFIKLRKHFDI